MKDILLKLYIKIQGLLSQEDGQDLVEYALIVALIALACTVGMKSLATSIGSAFTAISGKLDGSY
jgi:pilus assembly protein Flp/PilA